MGGARMPTAGGYPGAPGINPHAACYAFMLACFSPPGWLVAAVMAWLVAPFLFGLLALLRGRSRALTGLARMHAAVTFALGVPLVVAVPGVLLPGLVMLALDAWVALPRRAPDPAAPTVF